MHRLLAMGVVFFVICACGSAPPSSSLAGTWGGNALSTFSVPRIFFTEPVLLQVSIDGGTATIDGICGGAGDSTIGNGTVEATVTTIGTGTFANWQNKVTCPARRIKTCDDVVFTYTNGSILVGINTDFGSSAPVQFSNSLNLAAEGTSSGCGLGTRLVTQFLGTPAVAAQ
jgi:hypothetical protein